MLYLILTVATYDMKSTEKKVKINLVVSIICCIFVIEK